MPDRDPVITRQENKKAEKMKETVQKIYDALVLFVETDNDQRRRVYFFCINKMMGEAIKQAEKITTSLREN